MVQGESSDKKYKRENNISGEKNKMEL